MAVFLLNTGDTRPLGQFDFQDSQLSSVTGGQFGTWGYAQRFNPSVDQATFDADQDGYVYLSAGGTPYADGYRAQLRLANLTTETNKVFYLLDDGSAHYGVTFGYTIGITAGLGTGSGASVATNLGLPTYVGSGKVTAWALPGMFAVSLDSVSTTLATPTVLNQVTPGQVLYRESTTAELTTAATTTDKLGYFVEYSNNGSLVTTPGLQVGAVQVFDRLVFQFLGA